MTDLHPVREAGEVLGKQQPGDQIHQYYDSEPGDQGAGYLLSRFGTYQADKKT